MSHFLRKKQRINYAEPPEPNMDEYIFCSRCKDYVYEYCSIHGELLVVLDDKVPSKSPYPPVVPRAALTIPHVFLHIAPSTIPGAGLGVFSTLTLPSGVRFGPYRGNKSTEITSDYCWQLYDGNGKPSKVVDAGDANNSNWMRYVNCSRHWSEQNLVAFQYFGEIYYRTVKIIPRYTELLVFYGAEFANRLRVNIRSYNSTLPLADTIHLQVKKSAVTSQNNVPGDHKHKESLQSNLNVRTNDCNIAREQQTEHVVKTNVSQNANPLQNEFLCDICQYLCKNKKALESHLVLHTLDNVHKCTYCGYICKEKTKLAIHLLIHTGEKQFKCNVCDYICNHKGHLKTHMRIHTGEKPFACNVCDYICNRKDSLKIHMRVHTGEKPFACNVCDYKCIQNGDLKRHMRVHTGEKPYTCTICKYRSAFSNALKRHMRSKHSV